MPDGPSNIRFRTLGWLTLAFEIAFPLFMWFERARWRLLAVGTGLHLGIAAVFPIPGFGIADPDNITSMRSRPRRARRPRKTRRSAMANCADKSGGNGSRRSRQGMVCSPTPRAQRKICCRRLGTSATVAIKRA